MKFRIEWSNRELLRPSRRRDTAISLFRHSAFFPAFGDFFRLQRRCTCRWLAAWPMGTMGLVAHGYNGSHGPWLQWDPWPMVTMGPVAHGYNGSHGPMVTMGPMTHGYDGPHGPCGIADVYM